MVWNSLALDGITFARHGIDSCRWSNQTGGTGDARITCGVVPSRSPSLRECARYLLRHSIVTCSPVVLLSDAVAGGHSMPGGSHGPIASLSSIQGSLLSLPPAGGRRRISSTALPERWQPSSRTPSAPSTLCGSPCCDSINGQTYSLRLLVRRQLFALLFAAGLPRMAHHQGTASGS